MNTLKPLTTVAPSHVPVCRPAAQALRSASSPIGRPAAATSDAWKGTKFGVGLGAGISVPVGLGLLITSGERGLLARVPGRLAVAAGITAGCAVVFGAAGAAASKAKTQTGAALTSAAIGTAVGAIVTGVATKNLGMTAFGAFTGAMLAGIIGNGVGEHLGRPE
jgi:hypothetical protein